MHLDISLSLARPERVDAVRSTALLGTAPEQAFDRATRLAAAMLDVPIAMVNLIDAEEQFLKSCIGLPEPWQSERTMHIGEGLCPLVTAGGTPLVVSDAREVPMLAGNPAVTQFGVVGYAGVPLRSRTAQVLGAFCVADLKPRHWTESQIGILHDLAATVETEIELRVALAEASRREHEIRARKREKTALLDSVGSGLYGIDAEGRCTFVNAAGARLLGYAASELLGRQVQALVQPESADGDRGPCGLRAVWAGRSCHDEDAVFRRKDGSSFPVEMWAQPIRSGDRVSGVVVSFADITERKLTERMLTTENQILERIGRGEPLRDVLASLAEAIEPQTDGAICSVLLLDESGERLRFGAGPGLPDAYNQAVDGIRVGPRAGSCGTAIHRGEVVVVSDIETDPLWEDFRALALAHGLRSCWSAPIHAASGTILGTFAVYNRQPRTPTARELQIVQRAAHLAGIVIEREQVMLALRQSESLFRSLVEHSQDAIVICEPDGVVRYGSSSIQRLLGYDAERIPGRQILDFIHPGDRPAITGAFLHRAERPGAGIILEFRLRHADGTWRRFEAYAHNLLDQPAVAGIMVIGRDITERQAFEEQLRHVQKMEAVGKLAGGIAHDFNNLLTVVRGNASLLAMDPDAPRDERVSLVAEIQDAANRSASLTRQLLAFSRKQILRLRTFNINGVVAEMRPMLQRLIGADIALVTDLDPTLPAVQADSGQMEQVLLNLVVNARDAMPGGGRLSIRTRRMTLDQPRIHGAFSIPAGCYAVLAVRDSGCGMDETTRTRCFEPFFTTKEVGQGTGLGLAMVYGIVRQSQGYITVESRQGEGTLFEVFLPRQEVVEREEPIGEEAGNGAASGSETILLVEDEPQVRRLARRVLERNGYRVLEAGSAPEALQVVAEHATRIDLLLSDVVLAGMSGPVLAERVSRRWPGLRTVLMSGYPEGNLGPHSVGPDRHFLQKPFSPDALARRIRAALDA